MATSVTSAPGEDYLIRKTLKLVRLFEGFSEQDARDFLVWAKRFDARPNEHIIVEGERGQDMFVVATGELRVLKSVAGGDEELATLQAGDSFGEIALLDSGPRSASVVAITASTLLRFERRNLVKIPSVSLKLYRNVASMVASRLRDTSTRVILSKVATRQPSEPEEKGRPSAMSERQFKRSG